MKTLTKKQLEDLYGYWTGTDEAIGNGQTGMYTDPETEEITIVTCCRNCGDYTRVTFNLKEGATPDDMVFIHGPYSA
jgi:hypothetical protein